MIRILYVDDNQAFLDMAALHFTTPASTVQVHLVADQALELLEGGDFHAVVSDLDMPGMSGLEFLAQVKARCPKPYRILISSSESRKFFTPRLARLAEVPYHYFFHKPYTSDDWKRLHQQIVQKVAPPAASRLG